MEPDEELDLIVHQIASIEQQFVDEGERFGQPQQYLPDQPRGRFTGLVAQAKTIIDNEVGTPNHFGTVSTPATKARVIAVREVIYSAAKELRRRKATRPAPLSRVAPNPKRESLGQYNCRSLHERACFN